jgi:hypothetical protein
MNAGFVCGQQALGACGVWPDDEHVTYRRLQAAVG